MSKSLPKITGKTWAERKLQALKFAGKINCTTERKGLFTLAVATSEKLPFLKGVGIIRKSEQDKPDQEFADKRANGFAISSLLHKIARQPFPQDKKMHMG